MGISRFITACSILCFTGLSLAQSSGSPLSASFIGKNFSANIQRYYHDSRHGALNRYNGSEITKLSLHRSFGPNALHYATTSAPEEQHHYAGLSAGRATVAFFQGKGRSFSKAGMAPYRDLNHYFFHGGSYAAFNFDGAAVNFQVAGGLSTQFAGIRVKAADVEDRYGYYAGVTTGRLTGGVFALERGADRVGHGLNLSFAGTRSGVEFQQIQSATGAYLRRVGFSWRRNARSRWSMELEDAHNPLFAGGDDQRVMFRFQRSLGRSHLFRASEEKEQESTSHGSFAKVAGIGVGVGVVAAAVSSGDSGRDDAQRFATQNEAAYVVLNDINPVSVRLNREHGGWVYKNADNTFGHTIPVIGDVASVNIGNPATAVPSGTLAAASYHTHAGPDPRYDNENFSPQDIASDNILGVDGYLGTPAGLFKYHELATGRIITLGTIAN